MAVSFFLPPFQGSPALGRYLGFRRSGSTLGYIPAAASRLPNRDFFTAPKGRYQMQCAAAEGGGTNTSGKPGGAKMTPRWAKLSS